jgi:hypothetical protein
MTARLTRLAQALMLLSLLVTAAKLSTERAGDYLFTMIGLVLLGTAAPYLMALAVARRTRERWALAITIAVCVLGVVDVAWRVQAFFFPTDTSHASMGLWLPLSSVWAIPLAAVIAHTFLNAFSGPAKAGPHA